MKPVSHILKYEQCIQIVLYLIIKKILRFFLNNVNSSMANNNVSTQFADGGEFSLEVK